MKKYPFNIRIRPVKGGYILINTFIFADVCVKRGFVSNGASVPRMLWWLLPPFHPDYIIACFTHDYLCDKEQYKKADRVFNLMLKLHPRSKKWRRVLMVNAVKLWHKIAYDVNNQKRFWFKLIQKGK